MSVILTKRSGGGGGVEELTQIHQTIPSSVTLTIDSLSIAMYRSAKWIVTITDEVLDKSMAYEILGLHRRLTDANYNVYAMIGDTVNHTPDVQIVALDLVLLITNNEPHDIIVDVVRIPTLA